MWHEARKQERKIRGMLVDYRKRAERRQDFYEKIKADPTQFIQIYGRRCKIHLDPAIAAAGESPAIMMPWQGQQDNLIDRFDVRAHLDYIPPLPKNSNVEPEEVQQEERQCNYERYRILAQNDFLAISEDKYLHQLHLEEQFGVNATQVESEKPKKKSGGVAIGYTYDDDGGGVADTQNASNAAAIVQPSGAESDDTDSDIDVDVAIDINKLDTNQAHDLNNFGRNYGMLSNDFYSYLTRDADEAEALRIAKEEEQEKIMLCGRKSRRERRAQRERRVAGRPISPPSYAAKEEPTSVRDEDDKNDSDSRSPSPENSGKITYITSFGGEDELPPHSKISINFNKQAKGGAAGQKAGGPFAPQPTYADKVKQNLDKLKSLNNRRSTSPSPRKPLAYQRRSYSRSFSRDRIRRSPFSRRKTYGRSDSRDRRSSRSTSRKYRSRRRSSSRSRSRSRGAYGRRRAKSSSSSSSSSTSSSSGSRRSSRRRSRRSHRSTSTSTSSSSTSSRSRSRSRTKQKSTASVQPSRIAKPLVRAVSPVKLPETPAVKPALSSGLQSVLSKKLVASSAVPVSSSTTLSAVQLEQPPPPPPPAIPLKLPEPQVPIRKYYGRKRDDQSSSEAELSADEEADAANSDGSSTTITKGSSISGKQPGTSHTKGSHASSSAFKSFNPRDRLKRKMQNLLNKQYEADKLAEIERTERQVQQQQEREDEIREIALRLRRRKRELRHKYGSPSSSHSGEESDAKDLSNNDCDTGNGSQNHSRNGSRQRSISRKRSRSRSSSRPRRRYSNERRQSPKRQRNANHTQQNRWRDNDQSHRRSRSRSHRSPSRNRRSRSNHRRSRDRRPSRDSAVNSRSRRPSRDERHTRKLVDY